MKAHINAMWEKKTQWPIVKTRFSTMLSMTATHMALLLVCCKTYIFFSSSPWNRTNKKFGKVATITPIWGKNRTLVFLIEKIKSIIISNNATKKYWRTKLLMSIIIRNNTTNKIGKLSCWLTGRVNDKSKHILFWTELFIIKKIK